MLVAERNLSMRISHVLFFFCFQLRRSVPGSFVITVGLVREMGKDELFFLLCAVLFRYCLFAFASERQTKRQCLLALLHVSA